VSSKYQHIFFDLDRTLWDFGKNSTETLTELFKRHQIGERTGVLEDDFIPKYKEINEDYWELYRQGKMSREELRNNRFGDTLNFFGLQDPLLAAKLGEEYIDLCPKKTNLFPFTHEVLDYLAGKYELHILTNGFEEVQHIKLRESKLRPFFKAIITSEQAGAKKPDAKAFHYSLESTGAHHSESLMIGDDPAVDLLGALNVGMDQVFFNPHREENPHLEPTFEISCLSELKEII